jgi:two-component system sensor histidine kinase RstB
MMRGLYVRIAVGIVCAVLAGSVTVMLLVPRLAALFQDAAPRNNLAAIAARLDEVSPSQWSEELHRLQPRSRMSLRIVDGETLLAEARNRPRSGLPSGSNISGLPALYLPIHGGSHFLVAAPLGSPPLTPALVLALIFVFVLIVTASAIVGIPLVRRLQRLQRAVGELGGGNWAMRLDVNAEGALSELAESINKMAAQLHEQFQEREALLQTVSHEMGTPLARMRFQLALIETELPDNCDRQRLSALRIDLDELDELSTELVSWMEPSSRNESRDLFKLAPIIHSLVELECKGKRNDIRVYVTASPELHLTADRRQFQRVMENLLRNALRYAQSSIVIEAASSEKTVNIEVRDDGPGIRYEHRARVLEPFVRLDEATVRPHHRGLGLGLSIVRRIVEAHGGSIVISEAPEGGTSVLTRWPRTAKN